MEFASAGISLPGKHLPAQPDAMRVVSPRAGETAFVLCEGLFYAEAMHALIETLLHVQGDPAERVKASLRAADRAVAKRFVEEDDEELGWSLLGAGSTVLCTDRCTVLGWVGCTRALAFRSGQVLWQNRTHTLAHALEDQGIEITPDNSAMRDVLFKCLGHPQECVEPEVVSHSPVEPGDIVMLCSSQVDDLLNEGELFPCLEPEDLARSAQAIGECAVARGAVGPATVLLGQAL